MVFADKPTLSLDEIRIRGRTLMVPSIEANGAKIVVHGNWLKLASIKDADVMPSLVFSNPQYLVACIKESDLRADVFTFTQKFPETAAKFGYLLEWDNLAVVPITTYKEWLENRAEYDVRKGIKKAIRLGVTAASVEFNDDLVRGIVKIYAESPTRQGKSFWHYKKDFDTVKHEAGTYLDRCKFIGAYFEGELIGFIKMAILENIASTVHVIAMKKHHDKKTTSLLLAKAIEICEQKRATHLTYGNYEYDDIVSSLTEFKRRHGFEKVLIPKYHVPLTTKGRLALALGAHHGMRGMVPVRAKEMYRMVRAKLYRYHRPVRLLQ